MKTVTFLVVMSLLLSVATPAQIRASSPSPAVQTWVLPATISGTIDLPGQQDRFSFTGAAGQQLYFDTLDYDSDSITATLYAPSGATVFNVNHSSDNGPFYLLESG